MILYNKTKEIIVSRNIEVADSFLKRLSGLIPRNMLKGDEGLLINNCRSVHSCFMRFDIDVVFVDKGYKVIKIITLKPWRITGFYPSSFVIEFNANFVYDKISIGDIVEVS